MDVNLYNPEHRVEMFTGVPSHNECMYTITLFTFEKFDSDFFQAKMSGILRVQACRVQGGFGVLQTGKQGGHKQIQ